MLGLQSIFLLTFQIYLLSISETTWLYYIDLFCKIKIFSVSCSFKHGCSIVVSDSRECSYGNLAFYRDPFPFYFYDVMMCNKLL